MIYGFQHIAKVCPESRMEGGSGGGRDVILGSKPMEYCWRLAAKKRKRIGSKERTDESIDEFPNRRGGRTCTGEIWRCRLALLEAALGPRRGPVFV